jgi:hypothetical protein
MARKALLLLAGLATFAALAGCRTGGGPSQLADDQPVSTAVPSAAINCGSLSKTYNDANGVTHACWGDGSDERSKCFKLNGDGTKTYVDCDDLSLQACPGALGSGCGLHDALGGLADYPCDPGDDPDQPWRMKCIVGVASVLHDACCSRLSGTGQQGSGCLGNWGIEPFIRKCDSEWQEAIFDDAIGFLWKVEFDTRQRIDANDAGMQRLSDPDMLDLWNLRAPAGTAIGGYRYGVLPNPLDAALSLIFHQRDKGTWASFCSTNALDNSWLHWVEGEVVCQ